MSPLSVSSGAFARREAYYSQVPLNQPTQYGPVFVRRRARRTYPCTTPLLTPNIRAMTRSVRPWCLKRRISLTRRIDNLAELCCFLDEPIFKADNLFETTTLQSAAPFEEAGAQLAFSSPM